MNKDKDGLWILETELPVTFDIKVSPKIFSFENKDVLSYGSQGSGSRRLLFIDLKVSEIYLKEIVAYFKHHEIDYHVVIIDSIETNKSLETLIKMLKEMEVFGLTRKSEPIICIGGGVLLDIAGFAASIYRRGVPYIKVPTTLIGIVDAAVGVKTAINFETRRNRLGTYYPPISAYLDKAFLKTLDPVEISSGFGEIIKMAIVKDLKLFKLLQEYGKEIFDTKFNGTNSSVADEVISLSIKGMKDELQENLWEKNLERYVDFGHSFCPIPEMRSLEDDDVESLTHGQAVTLDVIFSSILSYKRGYLLENDIEDIFKVVGSFNLATFHPYFGRPALLLEALNDTVKHRNGDQNLPIPISIGKSIFINDCTFDEIKSVCLLHENFHEKYGHNI